MVKRINFPHFRKMNSAILLAITRAKVFRFSCTPNQGNNPKAYKKLSQNQHSSKGGCHSDVKKYYPTLTSLKR